MNTFFSGVDYLFHGFQLITKPGIRPFVIIPLLINLFLFIAFFFLFSYLVNEFNLWFQYYLPSWLQWFSILLWLLFFFSFFFFFLYTFVTIANIISSPFNGFLAEKVALYLTGSVAPERSLLDNIKDIPRIVGRQFLILGYYLPRALLLFLLFFIPVVQTIAPIVWVLFNAWFLCMTFIDYPSDNDRISIKAVREWQKQRRFVSLGFGFSVLITTLIPVLNFFTIPAAVAGATAMWIKESK